MKLGDGRQDLELTDGLAVGRVGGRLRGGPVDGLSLENGFRQLVERARSSVPTGHLFGETHERALGRLVRGSRGRLPEKAGDLLVGVTQLYSENDRFPLFRAQPRRERFS